MDIQNLEVTSAQLAKLVDVSDRRIRQLAEEGILERISPNRYLLGVALTTLLEIAAGSGSDLNKQRTRKIKADAERSELEIAKSLKLVVPVADFERALSVCLGIVRERLRQIPQRVTPALVGETDISKIKKTLMNEVNDALNAGATAMSNLTEADLDETGS